MLWVCNGNHNYLDVKSVLSRSLGLARTHTTNIYREEDCVIMDELYNEDTNKKGEIYEDKM